MHTIRLRHPWECQACDAGVRWLRPFNWPTGLTDGETARLVVEGLPNTAKIVLNEQVLVLVGEGVFDISTALVRHNRLAIEISGAEPTDQTECPYDVRLEIVEL